MITLTLTQNEIAFILLITERERERLRVSLVFQDSLHTLELLIASQVASFMMNAGVVPEHICTVSMNGILVYGMGSVYKYFYGTRELCILGITFSNFVSRNHIFRIRDESSPPQEGNCYIVSKQATKARQSHHLLL
jgi:hypothetical protein